jgi:hypothetical protein
MTRNLAQNTASETDDGSPGRNVESGKALLNRRGYLRLGAAAVGVSLASGGLAGAATSGETFTTDFSEYAP